MASVIDIINRGLSKLGEQRITSLEDPTKEAKLAASLYHIVRDAEIEAHAWNFAKDRKVVTPEVEKPAFGWAHQYLMPADCLRILEAGPWPQAVMDNYIDRDTSAFAIEGRKILTNHGPVLNLIYLRRVEDSGYYPPVFVEVLACKLAVEMAESLPGSNSKRELAWNEYEMNLRLARRLNAIGRPPQALPDGSWMAAHMIGVV